MLFCSWNFAQFFAVVFAVYWLVPWRRLRLNVPLPGRRTATLTGHEVRIWWLLAASFYFYASWSRKLALVIVASTLLDYVLGLGLQACHRTPLRRLLLGLSLTANLGLLCYFKYVNFFLGSLQEALRAAGVSASLPMLKVILPVGISFYTFEAINYTVEVYRRRVPAERNPAHLLFFVLFFPHLIAGPIVRAKDFLPQIRRGKRWSWARFQLGAEYFLLGLMKKWLVADQLAAFADPVFAAPEAFGTLANWLALLAFTLQVYCDISGYSDMALGTAHLLGYKLAMNFNMPYLATSMADYWRRDHISLSTWLRDYLFIPLGGSRGTNRQTCRNLLITLTLGGLWHGASWNFALWGFLHGVLLSINHGFRSFSTARPRLEAFLRSAPRHRPAHGPDVLLRLPGVRAVPRADVRPGPLHVSAPVGLVRGTDGHTSLWLWPVRVHRGRLRAGPRGRLSRLVGPSQLAIAGTHHRLYLCPGVDLVHGAGADGREAVHLLPVLRTMSDEPACFR